MPRATIHLSLRLREGDQIDPPRFVRSGPSGHLKHCGLIAFRRNPESVSAPRELKLPGHGPSQTRPVEDGRASGGPGEPQARPAPLGPAPEELLDELLDEYERIGS